MIVLLLFDIILIIIKQLLILMIVMMITMIVTVTIRKGMQPHISLAALGRHQGPALGRAAGARSQKPCPCSVVVLLQLQLELGDVLPAGGRHLNIELWIYIL